MQSMHGNPCIYGFSGVRALPDREIKKLRRPRAKMCPGSVKLGLKRNPPLTTADGEETISEVPLEFSWNAYPLIVCIETFQSGQAHASQPELHGSYHHRWGPSALRGTVATPPHLGSAREKRSVCGTFNNWNIEEASRLSPGRSRTLGRLLPRDRRQSRYKFWSTEIQAPTSSEIHTRANSRSPAYPLSNCIVRDANAYPWHDGGFAPPDFSDLILYQLHVGAFGGPGESSRQIPRRRRPRPISRRIGVNALQLLPIDEFPHDVSLGYNGLDYFSPEMAYWVPPGQPPVT